MINTALNFQSALTYVMTEPDPLAVSFEGDMKAAALNAVFQNIEDQINFLYEKTRLLEDIRDYTHSFVNKAIEERRAKIVENLKMIEMVYDEVDDPSCIVEPIIVQKGQTVKDRDGTLLPVFDIINNVLVMPGRVLGTNDILKVSVKEQTQKLSDSETVYKTAGVVEPLVQVSVSTSDNKQFFLDSYANNKPAEGTVTTTYEILFAGNKLCNYVSFSAVNDNVIKIVLYDIDNNMHLVMSDTAYTKPLRVVKALVTLQSKGYVKYPVQLPFASSASDSFSDIQGGNDSYDI